MHMLLETDFSDPLIPPMGYFKGTSRGPFFLAGFKFNRLPCMATCLPRAHPKQLLKVLDREQVPISIRPNS